MKRHPAKPLLLAYAESLVDERSQVSAAVAGHVARCPVCAREVQAMRDSLGFAADAPCIEPSETLTAGILFQAQSTRHALKTHRRRSATLTLIQGLACAAGIVLVATVYFSAALEAGNEGAVAAPVTSAAKQVAEMVPSIETLREAAAEIQTLSAAISAPSGAPRTLWEREHLHAVRVLNADIAAALAALERNPGCTRATNLVNANIQRQAETLRTLYIERSL